ncbi:MAG: hypothetical protein OEW69_08060 [Nitrospirota bacterium]|nr:hypothetical protein [Nitrospirota bacterium]
MSKLKKYSKITLFLSGFSLIALLFSHLALTDIYHGEIDLSLEWTILRIAAIIFLAFIIFTVFTIRQVFKIT